MIMTRNDDGTYSQVGFIKDNSGADMEYIKDKDGVILFEKGFTREKSGALPLQLDGIGKDLKDYTIKGNTYQAEGVSPDTPQEIVGAGDYDSTTGRYKIPVETRGKNLINIIPFKATFGTGSTFIRDFLNSLDTGTYAVSYNTELLTRDDTTDKSIYGIRIINETGNFEITPSWGSVSIGIIKQITLKITITDDNKGKFANVYFYGCGMFSAGVTGSAQVYDFQLELGSKATEYEPYHPPITTPIHLDKPLYKIGDYADSVNYAGQKVERVVREDVLTGNEGWRLQSINEHGIANFYFYPNGTTPNFVSDKFVMSSHFEQQNTTIADTNGEGVFLANRYIVYIRVKQERASTVADFKSWLAEQYANGTPVKVYYILAEPETESIELPAIPTIDGTTIISIDTAVQPSEMQIKYKSRI